MESEKVSKIPIPYELSQWDSRTEVFYKCPECGCDMRLLGRRQNYCYKCGLKLDWEFCIQYVTEEIKEKYWSAETTFYNNEIDINEMKQVQNNIMFEVYEFACERRREETNKWKAKK